MELAALVAFPSWFLGQLFEVFHGFGHGFAEEPYLHSAHCFVANRDIEPDLEPKHV